MDVKYVSMHHKEEAHHLCCHGLHWGPMDISAPAAEQQLQAMQTRMYLLFPLLRLQAMQTQINSPITAAVTAGYADPSVSRGCTGTHQQWPPGALHGARSHNLCSPCADQWKLQHGVGHTRSPTRGGGQTINCCPITNCCPGPAGQLIITAAARGGGAAQRSPSQAQLA